MNKQKILFIVNEPRYFVSHRLHIAKLAAKNGFEVIVAGPGRSLPEIDENKFTYIKIPLSRGGKNIIFEIKTVIRMFCLIRSEKPNLLHLISMKPVIYGGLASRVARVRKVVCAITGMGYMYTNDGFQVKFARLVVSLLYKLAIKRDGTRVIVQNTDDLYLLQSIIGKAEGRFSLIPGVGVELEKFTRVDEPEVSEEKGPVVLLIGRMLADKGVREFIDAARLVKKEGVNARFIMIGSTDEHNPTSRKEEELKGLTESGVIEWLGHVDNVNENISAANIVVLPSYREGFPKALIEAASCGRAIITTDVPGCRDAVIENETGLLVPVKNSQRLAEAIMLLVKDKKRRMAMGYKGRQRVERLFRAEKIAQEHMDIYTSLLVSA